MLDNKRRRDILNQAKSSNYEGSVMDLFAHASQGGDVSQLLQPQQDPQMLTASTPEEKQTGLREQHAAGNTGASMSFPNVPANTSFNTKGMKVPMDISKYDEQGHLMQSFKAVPPGVESLPTGPSKGTVVETPAYKTGGFKGKYQEGGVNLDTTTREGLANYRKAYSSNSLANMQEIDGEQVAVMPDLDTIELSNDGEVWGGGENHAPKDWMGTPMARSSQNQAYMRNQYKNNPVARGAMKNTTGDSGDLWGNVIEGTKDAGLLAASTMAPVPGLCANAGASNLVNSVYKAGKYEVAAVKSGIEMLKNGKYGVGALKTLYHGSKVQALPLALPTLGNVALKTIKGEADSNDAATAASIAINMNNPLGKLPYGKKVSKYLVENSKDLIKTGASVVKGKYTDALAYLSSTFTKNKAAKMSLKLAKNAIPAESDT